MGYGIPFVVNFPRRSRPRGLGYASDCGITLSGLSSWVVDTEYGLGPRFREGYNRPYPPEAMPTRYPRAQAARVLGPVHANVVARPFAATRQALTRYPVRMAPITAPGARLRNPGVSGIDGIADSLTAMADVSYSATQSDVLAPALGGLGLGIVSRVSGVKGPLRTVTGLASFAGMIWGSINFYRHYQEARAASEDTGVAAAGARVGESVSETAKTVVAKKAGATDAEKRQVLASYACYENARRAKANAGWWEKVTNSGAAARNPLSDCGLTAEQFAHVKSAFSKISRADRARLNAAYKPGHALEDLGPGA